MWGQKNEARSWIFIHFMSPVSIIIIIIIIIIIVVDVVIISIIIIIIIITIIVITINNLYNMIFLFAFHFYVLMCTKIFPHYPQCQWGS